jgi:hypothetical protein
VKLHFTVILLSCALSAGVSCTDNDRFPQQADPDFIAKNTLAYFSPSDTPTVLIDEAHNNFHTASGRFEPFVQVLLSDGFTVKPNKKRFTSEHLKQADILVIANALDANRHDWSPPFNDAFSADEVTAVKEWVVKGGALLLIADHAPFPRAIETLSDAFGFKFSNGHVDTYTFTLDNGGLPEHDILNIQTTIYPTDTVDINIGVLNALKPLSASITQIKTFGGSAFQIPKNAEPILTFGAGVFSLEPEIPFQINADTARVSMNGWHQGATLKIGEGRVAVFAEAMMFTSQIHIPTGKKMGLVSKGAEQNEPFLLNVMRWLSLAVNPQFSDK